jgi:curved DNA-binding protein CbpA
MDYDTACKVLNLQSGYTDRMLKASYYKKALKYHPDKNKSDPDAGEKFSEINSAYSFLREKGNTENFPKIDTSYRNIIKQYIKYFTQDVKFNDSFLDVALDSMINNCGKLSIRLFKDLKKNKSVELFEFLSNHREIFGISEEIIDQMKDILREKMRDDNIVILNPSLTDILSDNVYKLELSGKTFYVPLWHNEVVFDHSGNDVIVKCVPEMEKFITIDSDNNIHFAYNGIIHEVLQKEKIELKMGDKVFEIIVRDLLIKKYQTYTFKNKGLLKINSDHIFSTDDRANIVIEIKLE